MSEAAGSHGLGHTGPSAGSPQNEGIPEMGIGTASPRAAPYKTHGGCDAQGPSGVKPLTTEGFLSLQMPIRMRTHETCRDNGRLPLGLGSHF